MEKSEAIQIVQKYYSYNPELLKEMLEDIEKVHNRKFCFFEFISVEGLLIRNTSYKRAKLGELIEIDSTDWKYHGYKAVVEKKRFGMVECYIPNVERVRLRLNPNSIKFIPQEEKKKLNVKVGDLVLIKESRYRPRYEEGDFFKVVWKGAKYVRVIPKNPRFHIHVDQYATGGRPGDEIKEFADKDYGKIYRESVYSIDIPITELIDPIDRYGEERGSLVKGMDYLGF